MPYAAVNGIQMFYKVRGEGEPVVLAHGAGGNHLVWWQQLRPFAERYQVITFDHRNFGLTSDDGAGANGFVDDLTALLDHLGIERAALVGQSLGGFTCAGFASRHPERVRALVLAGSPAGLLPPRSQSETEEMLARVPDDWEGIQAMMVGQGGFKDRHPDLCALYEEIGALNWRVSKSILATIATTHYDIAPIIAAEVPVLMINGEEDASVDEAMASIAAGWPGSRRVTVPDTGHLLYFEQATTFNHRVLSFLAEHLQPTVAAS